MSQVNANFVDFVLEAQENPTLLKKFLQLTKFEELRNFFNENNFKGVTNNDIYRIMGSLEDPGKGVGGPCPFGGIYY